MIPRRIPAALFLVLALALLTGCPFITSSDKPKDNGGGQDTGYKPLTTIDNVLYNLQKSYVEMKYDEYIKLFDSRYTYIFAPQDIGVGDPTSWGLPDELASAQHIFSKTDANEDGYVAEKVTLTFERGPDIPNDIEDWTKVVLSNVFLSLDTRHQVTGDPLTYLVQGDQAYLWFAKTGLEWKIVQWEDKPIQGKNLIAKN